jgi:hypothetical protein
MTKDVSESQYWMKKFKPGDYTWSVSSIDSAGTPSNWSKKRKFSIGDVPKIEWADGKDEGVSKYAGVDPYVRLEWKSTFTNVERWRVRVAKEGKFESGNKWIRVKESPYNRKVPTDGFYQAQVQGVGENGTVVGQTSIRRIRVIEQPLLPGPKFAENIPEKLKATARGNLKLRWSLVDGASEYIVQLKDEDDKVVENFTAEAAATELKSLKPGKYKVSVFAKDTHGRKGLEGEIRPVMVENKSALRAPAFKKVKVRAAKARKSR